MGSGGPASNGSWDYGKTSFAFNLPLAVNTSMTTEDKMDKALMRVLERRFRTGYDDPDYLDPWADLGPSTMGAQSHLDLALATARVSRQGAQAHHAAKP
jgi:hypothetical protein